MRTQHSVRTGRSGLLLAVLAVMCGSVSSADPPRVVRATPDHADVDVDPGLTEIRIEFDQDMSLGGRSICGGGESFPEFAGEPTWADKRTIVLGVRLKPAHDYHLSVNCPSARHFRGAGGEPAEIYPISFRTRAEGAASPKPPSPEENAKAIAALRKAIDESYSYRDLRKVDWAKAFEESGEALRGAASPAAFARAAARLLRPAGDIHVTVRVGDFTLATGRRSVTPNANVKSIQQAIAALEKPIDSVMSGRYDRDFGYINIGSWSARSPKFADVLVEQLDKFGDAKGVIIDVRFNSGGDESLAKRFASCFVEKRAVYSKSTYRDLSSPSGFGAPIDRVVEPRQDRKAFAGKVAVLIGPSNMSSCESFILMMKQAPRCRTFGAKTYGSSGNPKPHDLGNGVTVLLSSWQDLLPDGTLLEGRGIEPDVEIKTIPDDFERGDPVLDAALRWLRE